MLTTKDKKLKKEAKEFSAFITDIVGVMKKHKVNDLLAVFELNDQIRNTYIPLGGEEKELYCNISDGINSWLLLHKGYKNKNQITIKTSICQRHYTLGRTK